MTVAYAYSRGLDKFDAHPDLRDAEDFDEFASAVLGDLSPAKGKQYVCCSFRPNGDGRPHRRKEFAQPRRYVPFDIDWIADGETLSALLLYVQRYNAIAYTTASSTDAAPRVRILLDATRTMDSSDAERVCLALEETMAAECGAGTLKFDRSVYRLEQPLFTPPVGGTTWRYDEGRAVDVDALLLSAPPATPRQPGKIERLDSIRNSDAAARILTDKGMVKALRADGAINVVCPCASEHSSDSCETSTVYFLPCTGGYKTGRFVCQHAHCAGRPQEQFLAALGISCAAPRCVAQGDETAQDANSPEADTRAGGTQDATPAADPLAAAVALIENAIKEGPNKILTVGTGPAWRLLYENIPEEHGRLRTAAKSAGASVASIDKASRWKRPKQASALASRAIGDKPVIRYSETNLHDCVSAAENAMIAAGEQIYRRGELLVRPIRTACHAIGHLRRSMGTIVLIGVTQPWLRERLGVVAEWKRYDKSEEDWVTSACPALVAETYLSRTGEWTVPELRAVVQHPVFTSSGRIVATAGYDEETKLLIDIEGKWDLPAAPTYDDATDAIAKIMDLIRNFPFGNDGVNRAVALSMMLTAIARPTLPSVPGHAVDAPEAGSGKSLLVNVAAIIATGTDASVMDYGRDPVESGKRLDGLLLAGDAIIAIDNIEGPLEGAGLCQTITQSSRKIRPLGASTVVTVPMSSFILATGNNLTLRGDIVRRMLVCRLDADSERPETREFDQDVLSETTWKRKDIILALLTVLLAYRVAGAPGRLKLGSFDEWSVMVRSALIWVGEADPVRAIENARSSDPSREALHAVLAAWNAEYLRDGATAAEAIARANSGSSAPLRDALSLVAERRGVLDSRALGYWLRAHKDRRAGNLVLRNHGEEGDGKVRRWVSEKFHG